MAERSVAHDSFTEVARPTPEVMAPVIRAFLDG